MIIVSFNISIHTGGYGDRIVGIISCKLIANLLNKEFRINWTRENIKPYLNYEKYEYIEDNAKPIKEYRVIDNRNVLKEYLETSTELFPETSKFYINQEIAEFLYKNPRFLERDYLTDIFTMYKTLYTDILIPTEVLITKATAIVPESEVPVVGIQIRTGDIYIKGIFWNSYKVIENPETTLYEIFTKIKEHISFEEYKVFVTSDYTDIYPILLRVWDKDSVLYVHDQVQHMDRHPSGDFSKIFLDNYILSQKTDSLYISDCSNYGRVAALSSRHDTIFNLKCEAVDKAKLLTKA
jgi:hypothetical protein